MNAIVMWISGALVGAGFVLLLTAGDTCATPVDNSSLVPSSENLYYVDDDTYCTWSGPMTPKLQAAINDCIKDAK